MRLNREVAGAEHDNGSGAARLHGIGQGTIGAAFQAQKPFRTGGRRQNPIAAKHKGEVTAEVTLAQKPSEAHLAAIKDVLTAMTRKEVQMDVKVDPAIIGGLVVKLGSRMVDTSLRTKLNAIRLAMKEAR